MSVPFPIARPRVRRSPLLLGLVAIIAFAAALVNAGSAAGFPYSPLSGLLNALVTIDLVVIAVVLGGSAIVLLVKANRGEDGVIETVVIDRSGAPVVDRVPIPVMSIVGTVLTGVTIAAWIILGGVPLVVGAIIGHPLSYQSAAGPLALFGLTWVLGTCLGALGFHRAESARNRLFSGLAIGGGVLLMAPAVGFSILFAAGVAG
ncbi:hypothetical protein [Schumannella soli]|uniref:Uncharacterized protein n=1 Tax=Schumannella soli TaxID=2590779 RepID=A0A506Y1P4_9MICO|nr:hypothetical protein [Schumannella soli]TPW75813.1 hypothetical protein FJ657_08095 [Schumannella soli]